MCGIIAVKGDDSIKDVLEGLKKLKYRGYDSCGVSCKVDNELHTIKRVGYVDNLIDTDLSKLESNVAIGHTRWATHGNVSESNSHPHVSASGKFAIVHNGIIENYKDLKNKYLKGVKFASQTDSEVVAQLLDYFYNGDVWEAFRKSIDCLQGSYAIVMINSIDNKIYFARKNSPMVIGVREYYFAIASDVNGLSNIEQISYVNDDSKGYIDNKIHIYDKNNTTIIAKFISISADDEVSMGNFPHFMLKEIYEIPHALKGCFDSFASTTFNLPRVIDNILMVSCGTSYHSSLMGKKYFEEFAGIPTECEIASEYIYNSTVVRPNTLGIFISQSGETADTLSALKRAKQMGVFALAITNVRNSTITHLADEVIYLNAGAEIGVASTKAYTSQVFALLLLTNVLINNSKGNYKKTNNFSSVTIKETQDYLKITPDELEKLYNMDISSIDKRCDEIVKVLEGKKEIYLIGKNYDFVTAKEGGLKIKEISYSFTDAYPCGELKHGTIALIDEESVVIAIATEEKIFDKVKNSVHEIVARGGKVIGITTFDEVDEEFMYKLLLPKFQHMLLPIVSIIPLDLIAYKLSVARGINPDKPRNLAKSVTVE